MCSKYSNDQYSNNIFHRAFILQVKQLVDEALFARYDRLLLQSSLDLMADVVYCPRQSCGTAVMVEPDTTMGICTACRYAFCTLCKMGYHGLSHCKITAGNGRNERVTDGATYRMFAAQRKGMYFYRFVSSCAADELRSLRDEYLSATAEVQKFMEQRFGKRVIQKAVEESFSRDWLKENCKSCPRCGTNIQVWLPMLVTNQLNCPIVASPDPTSSRYWFWLILSFSCWSLSFCRKWMAATRWHVRHVNSTSAGCVWAYSAGSTRTVTLTTQIHPVITSKGVIFVFACWSSHSITHEACSSACFRLFHGVDFEAENAFWSDEEDWWISVLHHVKMHFISHDHQWACISTPVPLQLCADIFLSLLMKHWKHLFGLALLSSTHLKYVHVGGQHESLIPSHHTLQVSIHFLFSRRTSVALDFNNQSSRRKMLSAGIVCESSLCTLPDLVCCQSEKSSGFAFDTLMQNEKFAKGKLFCLWFDTIMA